MTKILVIAGEYPPLKTIGRIRTAKFVEHWHNEGHEPVVLTLTYTGKESIYEEKLEEEIPAGVKVYRVENRRREDAPINFIKRLLGKSPKDDNVGDESNSQPANRGGENKPNTAADSASPSLASRLIIAYKKFFRLWIDIPDDYVDWANSAFYLAQDIIKQHDIDIIYTSFPPFSACKLGLKLKQQTGLPWVVDYRDLWTGDVLREWVPPLRARFETHLEKKYVSQADAVVTVSEQKTEFLKQLLPPGPQLFETITNGYDSESFADLLNEKIENNDASGPFNIVYCGRLFKNRKGYTFLNALGEIAKQTPDAVKNLKVHYYGGIEDVIYEEYQRIIKQFGLGDIVECHGDVDFETAKRAQANADVLLLIVDTGATSDGVIPGKLFEYVAAKRPIFALSEAAATNQILVKAKLGTVLPPNDFDVCKKALLDLLTDREQVENYNPDNVYIQKFDRKSLAKEMIDIFERCIKK